MSSENARTQIRRDLSLEEQSLRQQLEELGFAEPDDTGLTYDANFADTSQVTAERSEAATVAATLRGHLGEVEHAIAKLEDGTYGICESCGQQIPDARLEAIPAGRLCMNCASGRR